MNASKQDTPASAEQSGKPNPKKRGLGRGLGALFEDEEGVYPQPDPEGQTPGAQRRMLGIDLLEPGFYQPRQHIDKDSIKELAESIAVHGVLQPLIVREKPAASGRYEIIAGERRWRASQEAGIHEVPAIIMDLDDVAALEIALIENLQREDLNILEEAQGYQRLMDEFGHTQEKLAASMGKSRSHVANTVRLLSLPQPVQTYVRQGKLSAGHARALITADNPEELAKTIINQSLSVREAEALVAAGRENSSRGGKSGTGKTKAKPAKDIDTLALEQEVSNMLGMKIAIDMRGDATGGGTMTVDFKSLDQLDDLLHRLSHFPGRQQAG